MSNARIVIQRRIDCRREAFAKTDVVDVVINHVSRAVLNQLNLYFSRVCFLVGEFHRNRHPEVINAIPERVGTLLRNYH